MSGPACLPRWIELGVLPLLNLGVALAHYPARSCWRWARTRGPPAS
jgi:hypothetical protein